jgi:uncharacterized oligopeptide transporter (OPT) family protein
MARTYAGIEPDVNDDSRLVGAGHGPSLDLIGVLALVGVCALTYVSLGIFIGWLIWR